MQLHQQPTEQADALDLMVNMGPQHPSTHGVFRVVIWVDGERIVRAEPHIGYLHRGSEKLCEGELYSQVITLFDRLDYVERLEVNYHLFSLDKRHKFVVKTSVSPDEPRVPSVISLWRGADWYEREAHDLFGVVFEGTQTCRRCCCTRVSRASRGARASRSTIMTSGRMLGGNMDI